MLCLISPAYLHHGVTVCTIHQKSREGVVLQDNLNIEHVRTIAPLFHVPSQLGK